MSEHTTGKATHSEGGDPSTQSPSESAVTQTSQSASEGTSKASTKANQSKASASKASASKANQSKAKSSTKKVSSKTSGKKVVEEPAQKPAVMSLGDYAHRMIRENFQDMVKCEKGVLADKSPEPLHQMRVSSRRLYTALSVFEGAIAMPKAASPKRVRSLTKSLGKLRDLDVQLEALKEEYLPHLDDGEQKHLLGAIARLEQQRQKAKVGVEDLFSQSRYKNLKLSYEAWIADPRLTPLGAMPMDVVLPDLLSPLLSQSLLHPGWLIAADRLTSNDAEVLHDLRKVCKFARYQSDFFTTFYGKEFKDWVKGLKTLQDSLGGLQDIQILHRLLKKNNVLDADTPQLQEAIQQKQRSLLASWEEQRQQYLDTDFRYQLHRMLLTPVGESAPS